MPRPAADAVTARCPGRVCLVGEDLDWMGGHTVQATIGLHVTVRATLAACPDSDDRDIVDRVHVFDRAGRSGRYPYGALRAFEAGAPRLRGEVTISSTLPASRGLASSAAVLLGVLACANSAANAHLTTDRLCDIALSVERSFGAQVGPMDFVACARGGIIAMGFDPPDWRLLERHTTSLGIVVIDSGTEHTTSASIESKARRWTTGDPAVEMYRKATDSLARDIMATLRQHGASDALGTAVSAAHGLLRDLMRVSTDALDEIVVLTEQAGAAGAKLTGSGEGGCAFALCSASDIANVAAAVRLAGYNCWVTEVSNAGLIIRKASRQ